jgi:hypothetical protein
LKQTSHKSRKFSKHIKKISSKLLPKRRKTPSRPLSKIRKKVSKHLPKRRTMKFLSLKAKSRLKKFKYRSSYKRKGSFKAKMN